MFDDLTDEELAAKIIELRTKIETVAGGGAVTVIAGEGRRKEFSRGNIDDLERLLNMALAEKERRANGGRLCGRALRVRHTY